MNRQVAWPLLCVLALISMVTIWRWEPSVQAPPARKSVMVKLPKNKKEAVVVPSGLDWTTLSENDLNEFSAFFGNVKSPSNFRIDTVMVPGESVVAEVYEARPGEFVCSKLTPYLKTVADGTSVVEVELDSALISIVGEQRALFSHFSRTHELKPQGTKSITELTDDGAYDMSLSSKIEGGGRSIRIRASGEYRKRPPMSRVSKGIEGD